MALMNDGDISFNLTLDDRDFRVSVSNAGRLLSELRGGLESSAKSTKKLNDHFSSFTTQLRHTVMTMASIRFMLMDINDVFLTFPQSVLRASGEIERMTKLMEGLSKESNNAKKQAEALSNTKFVFDMAQNAPFEVKAISDAFVKLKIAGIDPTKGSLQTLLDSISRFGGSSEHLHRAAVAIQQMSGKGVVSMEELRQQLGEAMPTAMQAMATGTGNTMAELTKKISKGTFEAKSALERMFAVLKFENEGASLRMMDTYVGQLEKLKTSWMLFANEVGTSGGFAAEVTKQLKEINALFADPASKQFAHSLSVGMKGAVEAIADFASFVKRNADTIQFVGEALVAFWAGSKVLKMFEGVKSAFIVFNQKYVNGISEIINAEKDRVAQANGTAEALIQHQKREIAQRAAANAIKIRDDAAAAARELEQNRAKYAALMAESDEYYARQRAADRIASSGRLSTGQFASAAEIANQRALATAYFERSMAAERMALQIKAAEAGLLATSTGTMAALRANTAAAAAEMAKLTTTTVATTSATRILGPVVNLLGGPIGLVTTALTIGAFAWYEWGRKGEEAAQRITDALQRTKDGYASLEDAQGLQRRKGALDAMIKDKEAELASPALSSKNASSSARARVQKELDALTAERNRLMTEMPKAFAQGAEASIQNSVRIVEQQVRAQIDTIKSASNAVGQKALDDLEERYQKGELKEKEYAARKSKLVGELATKNAQAEVDAIDRQMTIIKNHLKSIESGETPGGTDSPLYKGYQRQLSSMIEQKRRADSELAGAMNIGKDAKVMGDKENLNKSGLDLLIAQERAKVKMARAHFQNIANDVDGLAGLQAEVDAKVEEMVASDRFKRKVDGKIVDDGKDKGRVAELKKEMTEAIALQRAIPIFDGIQKKSLEMSQALAMSREGFEAGAKSGAQTSAVEKWIAALQSAKNSPVFEELKKLLAESGHSFDDYAKSIRDSAQFLDLNNFMLPLVEKTKEMRAATIDDERKHKQELFEIEQAAAKRQFDLLVKGIKDRGDLDEKSKQEIADRERQFGEYMVALRKKHERDIEHPMDRLAREWSNTTNLMEQATTSWADKTLDLIMQVSTTGKADFRSFVTSILSDIARIQMKESLGGLITSGVKASQQLITGLITGQAGKKTQTAGEGKEGEQASFFGSMIEKAGSGLKSFWNSLTGASEASDKQTEGIWSKVSAMIQEVFGITTKVTAEQAATTSVANLAVAAEAAATALASIGGAGAAGGGAGGIGGMLGAVGSAGWSDWFTGLFDSGAVPEVGTEAFSDYFVSLFADGGIMTSGGPLSLKKYANGGVANSPQLALFGEGDMNEAYVPLPDGRSIPVTMKMAGNAGAGTNVAISIVVNNNGEATTESTSSRGDDGGLKNMANAIKNIVVEQMVVQQRPGGVLYRG